MICSVADAIRSFNWPIIFKVLTLNVAIWTLFLHLSNFWFHMSLSSVADFSDPGAKVPTSEERVPSFPEWRAKQIRQMFWCRGMVVFCLFFSQQHSYRWVAVVSFLSYLTLSVDLWISSTYHLLKFTVDPTLDSSTLLHIYHTASLPSSDVYSGNISSLRFVKF